MPEYKVINDLQCSFYEAGLISEKPVVKIVSSSNPDPIYFYPDELRPLAEWMISCADKVQANGYVSPFQPVDEIEQAERESLADDTQVDREMAIPYLGEPVPYKTDDNISETELGLSSPF